MNLAEKLARYRRLLSRAQEVFDRHSRRLSALNDQIDRMESACETLQAWLREPAEPSAGEAMARLFKQRQQMHAHVQRTLSQQRQRLAHLQQQRLQLREQWLAQRAQVRAFEKLIERATAQLREQEERQRQRQQDERSAWQAAQRHSASFF